MTLLRYAFPLLVLSAGVSGCGFQPVYAPPSAGAAQVSAIGPVEIEQIDGRLGFFVKDELDRLFAIEERAAGTPRKLEVSVTELSQDIGLRTDASATRSDFLVRANYRLLNADGTPAAAGNLDVVVSYDIPGQPYADVAAQMDAQQRAAAVLAERLRIDLLMRLRRAEAEATPQAAPN
jgi:LPS-assembly lipoprotein